MQPSPSAQFLELAIFRLEDVCINVQEGMEGYLKTAALEKKGGIEATLRWLKRRKVKIALLTDYTRDELFIVLDRLGWGVGEEELIHMVILGQSRKANPVKFLLETAGLSSPQQALLVADTPRLLHCAIAAGLHFVFGVTNGQSHYQDLAREPFRALLDSTVQLPNYLLLHLPQEITQLYTNRDQYPGPPRLWYPAS